jgi:hypothetical protein
MTMQPYMELLNPMAMVKDLLHSYGKEVQDYVNPELAQIIQQWMMQQREIKQMEAMGIPPEMAQQAVAQGFTAQNAEKFIEQLGKQAGQAQVEEASGEGTESGTD